MNPNPKNPNATDQNVTEQNIHLNADSFQDQSDEQKALRQKAEEALKNVSSFSPENLKRLSPDETYHLLHELRVHQIELEMQNDELRKTKVELELSCERYFDLYDAAPVGYFIVSETGLISEGNLTATTMLGITRSGMNKQAFSSFIHIEDQGKYYFQKKQIFAGCDPQTCELRLRKSDGSFFWAQLSGAAATDENGGPCCRIAVTNIDARKESEAKQIALFNEVSNLKLAFDQHALISAIDPRNKTLDAVAVGVWVLDAKTNVLTFDDAMYRLFGVTRSKFPNPHDANAHAIHGDDQQRVLVETTERIARGESHFDLDFRVVLPNTSIRHIYAKLVVERGADGAPIRISGVDYDVTEQKKREFVYHQTFLALNASAIVAMTDRQGKITMVNDLFCSISGYVRPELIGQDHRIINSGVHDKAFFREMWSTISYGKSWIGEICNRRKDGSLYWVHTAINPIKSENGEIESYISVRFDITAIKEAQALLCQTLKLATIGELAAVFGHEINNPLTIAICNISDIRKEIAGDSINHEIVKKKIDLAFTSCERIRDVVKAFRVFSTGDSVLKEQVSINQCIDSTICLIRDIFSNDGVKISYTPAEIDYSIEGVFGQLQQVLMNLFLNAKESLLKLQNATISINVKRQDNVILIDISDNGSGIPKNIREKIFEPFFTTKQNHKKIGLGLTISAKLALEMGGKLELASTSKSETIFRITLPLFKSTDIVQKDCLDVEGLGAQCIPKVEIPGSPIQETEGLDDFIIGDVENSGSPIQETEGLDDFTLALRNTFLEEFSESSSRMETLLLILEKDPAESSSIKEIFRLMHNTKGSSRAVGLDSMAKVAHACENLLSDIRDNKIPPSLEIVNALLFALDTMKAGTQNVKGGGENSAMFDHAISRINLIHGSDLGQTLESRSSSSSSQIEVVSNEIAFVDFYNKEAQNNHNKNQRRIDSPNITNKLVDNPLKRFDSSNSKDALNPKDYQIDVKNSPAQNINTQANPTNDAKSDNSIRVNLTKLDEIQDEFGEQAILHSALKHSLTSSPVDMSQMEKMLAQLRKMSGNVQDLILSLRMVPFSTVMVRLNRAVRDIALSTNKVAEIKIEGGNSELDKNILEQLIDPLIHMVRNCVDHGIELPEERRLKNKPPSGTIKITARKLGRFFEIEIADDGKGLSKEKILAKAYSTGILPKGHVPESKDILNLIFVSGFSTKPAVTEFSGRGVGMDVVKTNIEGIGGTIDLTSIEGSGTNITLKIPLTLAIVPGLIVKALSHYFTIPQSDLLEVVRTDEDDSKNKKIVNLQGIKVLRLRDKILPVVDLAEILTKKESKRGKISAPPIQSDFMNIIILNGDSFQFGLAVASVEDTTEFIAKPLPSFLKNITHFSGASIVGDGSVALTLDIMGISRSVFSNTEDYSKYLTILGGHQESLSQHQLNTSNFLEVDVGATTSYLIPIDIVFRLEVFQAEDFEISGEQRVVIYRNSLLPIISLPDFLNLPFRVEKTNGDKSPVVVIRRGDNFFGIEVEQILDVATFPAKIDFSIRDRPGILGTIAISDRIFVVVDIFRIIDEWRSVNLRHLRTE